MKISVIIPTYNRLETVLRAIQSVIAQQEPAHEIIIVDDGSTDSTATTLLQQFPQINLIVQSNRGVSNARNRGLDAATGDWIALLDSDDEWLPEKLSIQKKSVLKNPEFRICHTDEIWIRKNKRVNAMKKHGKSGGWIFQACLPLCAISPSAVMIHKSVFDRVGNFDESLPACEDYDLWLRICAEYPVLYVDQPLLHKFGGHSDQLSAKHWGMDRFRIQALANLLKNSSLDDDYRQMATQMLADKLTIYTSGARKRQRYSQAECVEKKYAPFIIT